MTPIRFILPLIVAVIAVVPASCAQESATSGSSDLSLQDAAAAALPAWWQVTRIELVELDETDPAPAPRVPGKGPEAAPAGMMPDASGGKPGAIAPGGGEAQSFTATLRLTDQIFEALYSLDGTAVIQPVLDAGEEIDVSGAVRVIEGEDGTPHYSDVAFDQAGFLDLGKPRDEFEYPTVILGTEEADEFLASRDAARVEGTMRKLMGDTGDEL